MYANANQTSHQSALAIQELADKRAFWNQTAFYGIDLSPCAPRVQYEAFKQPVVESGRQRGTASRPTAIQEATEY